MAPLREKRILTFRRIMHILVTNDDGVMAPGLFALVQSMRQLGDVTIVAPDRNWSGGGHVKTLDRPLRAREFELPDGSVALASDGAPSDCVALALLGLVSEKIDIVVSGINPHANLGYDVTYSGTVTAAMEANIAGIPGIAVSLDGRGTGPGGPGFAPAAEMARRIVEKVIAQGLPKGIFLNVNVPALPLEAIKGFQLTRQGLRIYPDVLETRQDPRGHAYYWLGGDYPSGVPDEGTDIGALAQGYVSVTPLQLDLTAYQHMPGLLDWGWENNDRLARRLRGDGERG
jgi:5'-nucleotidase